MLRIWSMIKTISEEYYCSVHRDEEDLTNCTWCTMGIYWLDWIDRKTDINDVYLMYSFKRLSTILDFKVWELHVSHLHVTFHIICSYQSQKLTITKFAPIGTWALSYFKALSSSQRMGSSFKPTHLLTCTGSPSTWTWPAISIISNARWQIDRAWWMQGSGRPLTVIYLSPTVSTYQDTYFSITLVSWALEY